MTSPSTFTLGKAKDSSLVNISGVCNTSAAFRDQLNEAVAYAMNAGNWWLTVVKARVCIWRNCITWPRWVGTPLGMNVCNHNRQIQNRWYDFMPLSASDCSAFGRWKSNMAIVDDGVTPVFNNVPCGTANAIRVYTRLQADVGKTITLYGIDGGGQAIMTKDSLGNWQDGETLTLAIPYVQSSKFYREVERVRKDLTTGPLDVYQVDTATGLLLDMAHYDPSETDPMYRHSTIRGGCCYSNCSCRSTDNTVARKVEILAKLQFIPVLVDTDTVQIENITALKLLIQGIRLHEAGDDDGALKKQVLATKELNRELNNKLPIDQIPIEVSGCGTALPALHGIGQLM